MKHSNKISRTFARALNLNGLVRKSDTALVFYDLTFLESRLRELRKAFPKDTLHAVAVKANPLVANLRFVNKLGAGAEAASMPEIHLALKAGISPNMIIFDSPAKTREEIRFALKTGICLNADSMEELEVIREYMHHNQSTSTIGIRINPQVGMGKIAQTSVAGKYSKFGVPLTEFRQALQQAFLQNSWLSGVHVHIGSQGMSLEMLCNGARKVYEFTLETNMLLARNSSRSPIDQFDIGGGLPVSYHSGIEGVTITKYRSELQQRCPDLFTGKFRLVTEFGRYIYANAAWAISKVESVKRTKRIHTAMIHLGADMFLRESYMPAKWHHEIFVLDASGRVKLGHFRKYVIAGPLCFSGDVLANGISLPEVQEGEFIVIKDVGAYTLSMWSRYNSRQLPKIIGYKQNGKEFTILKRRESVDEVLHFWER